MPDGEVDPIALGRKNNTGSTALDNVELVRGADARVEQNARSGEGTGGEHDLATVVDVDDLGASVGGESEDTSDLAATADDVDDLGVQLQAKVLETQSDGKVGPDGASALAIHDGPRGLGESLGLGVWGLDGINLGPSQTFEEARDDGERTLVVTLAVQGWKCGTRVTFIQAASSCRHISPLPPNWPFVGEVTLLRVDEVESVDGAGTTKDTSSGRGSIGTELAGV